MYPSREIFDGTPIALVAAEVRFTDAARLRQQQTKDEIIIALEGRFPFAEPLHRAEMNLSLVGGGAPQIQERLGVVLRNGQSTETLTLLSESLTYETTAYIRFESLLMAVTEACQALAGAGVRPAVQRVGLRYINEVRVPGEITDVRDWRSWINESLLGHLAVGPDHVPVTGAQSFSTYDLGEGRGLNCRFAALDQGPVVVPQVLRHALVDSGPFFVLDFDGFEDFTGRDAVPLSAEVVRESLSAVHIPCGLAFQRSITDEARELFRGKKS